MLEIMKKSPNLVPGFQKIEFLNFSIVSLTKLNEFPDVSDVKIENNNLLGSLKRFS